MKWKNKMIKYDFINFVEIMGWRRGRGNEIEKMTNRKRDDQEEEYWEGKEE